MIVFAALLCFAQIRGVQFGATATPATVYVGQQVSYDASMQANARAQSSFLAPPQYVPPAVKGATLYDFPFDTLTSIHDVQVSGLTFKAYTYHRALFPLAPGVDTIPPATLVYTIIDPNDPYTSLVDSLHSTRQLITVLPLPVAGRPPDFTGAVGQFTVTMRPDSGAIFNVGTTFTLLATVTGIGNIDLLPRPTLHIPWATIVPTPVEPVHWDSTGTMVHGTKEFRWLVTPNAGGPQTIPTVTYPYFDPTTHQYVTAQTTATPVTVTGGTGKAMSAKTDTLAATPFPWLMQFVTSHLVVVIGIVVLILIGLGVWLLRSRSDDESDEEW
jgi:hypothetical protein